MQTSSVPVKREDARRAARSQRAPERGDVGDEQIVLVHESRGERHERGAAGKSRERLAHAKDERDSRRKGEERERRCRATTQRSAAGRSRTHGCRGDLNRDEAFCRAVRERRARIASGHAAA